MAILPTTKFDSLPAGPFSIMADFSGLSPASLKRISKYAQPLMQQDNEFYKNRLQLLAKLEGHPIDQASRFYPVDLLLKQHRIDKNQSLALQVKALYECYRKRISEIDPRNQYHLSLDDLPKLFAYDKAFNKIQLWKKLPGGNEYLNSEPMRNLTLTVQASQLRTWLESNPAVVNDVHMLWLWDLKLTSIPEEIGLLTNLTRLDLSCNQISNIENLDALTQLQSLDLDNNQIGKIEDLGTLTQLWELSLNGNQISKIENLNTLNRLIVLRLTSNQIRRIENLDTLTQLALLGLDSNQISKIENLGTLTNLRGLYLDNNQITKIENLDALTQLTNITLSNNQISKAENLDALAHLKELSLDDNQIRLTCDLLRHARQIKPFSILLKAPFRSFISAAKKTEDLVLHKLGLDNPGQYLFSID